jgi:PKD repeat protein
MIRFFLLIVLLAFCTFRLHAQCIVNDWTLPSEVCLQSSFLLENNSTAEIFEWDLCPYDLLATPALSKVLNTGLSSTLDLVVASDSGRYYGFAVDAYSNSVLRLDFDSTLENVPVKANLGNTNSLLEFPNSIAVIQEGSVWLGLVANAGNSNIVLLNFGNSLRNLPTATVLHSRSNGGFANIAIASPADTARALLIGEYNTGQVSVLHYPQGFLNPLDSQQSVNITGSTPIDIQLIRQCQEWKAVVLSFDNRKLYLLDFGSSLDNSPVVSEYGLTFGFEPYRLSIVTEGDAYYGFVTNTSGGLHRLAFETDIGNNPAIEALGSFGVLSNSRSLHIDAKEGEWKAFLINFSDGDLFRLSFKQDCGGSPAYAVGRTPGYIQYSLAGNQKIAVRAYQTNGTSAASSKELLVTSDVAPAFSIQHTNFCVNHDVYFDALNVEGVIMDYRWTFGDGDTSYIQAPTHTYSTADTFAVTLNVIADNLCTNEQEVEIAVFEEPVSDFLLPSTLPLCTNQLFEFTNVSNVNFSDPSWTWFVNGVQVSAEEHLLYQMNTPGPHAIQLVAAIPGCESASEAAIGPLTEGPVVDFDYSGICSQQSTGFFNKSTGSIQSYAWDFDDGSFSSQSDPTHTYSDFGSYSVTLSATDEAGCNNSRTKLIDIHSIPAVDFSVEAPPFSCVNTSTPFNNITVNRDAREITSWMWHFNDSTTQTERDGHHMFTVAGVYTVSLSATTADGCQAKGEKEVTIHESPATDFTHTPACDDVPVLFTGPSDNDIASWYWEIGSSYYTTSSPTHTFKTAGDYPLYLQVTGANGCTSAISRSVHVPVPLSPDFSLMKNCPDHEAVFSDMTTGIDSIMLREWYFDSGERFTGSPLTYTFQKTGTETITFKVTGQSGCAYQVSKAIEVVPSPVADFTADPAVGAYPHEVTFTNTSLNATSYLWSFSDGAVSNELSPVYTFQQVGSYSAKLTASNEQQCQDSFETLISTVAPLPDADIEMISLSPNPDGTSRLIITIHNRGNTILKNVFLDIDFSGGLTLRQQVPDVIAPGSKFNVVLNSGIVGVETLRYLCAFIELANDIAPSGNRACKHFEHVLLVLPAYPNPATAVLNLEWIAETEKSVRASLIDPLGRKILVADFPAAEGLNRQTLELGHLEGGVYSLLLEDGAVRKTQRILITR